MGDDLSIFDYSLTIYTDNDHYSSTLSLTNPISYSTVPLHTDTNTENTSGDGASVPEPSTFLLLGAGLIGLTSASRNKLNFGHNS